MITLEFKFHATQEKKVNTQVKDGPTLVLNHTIWTSNMITSTLRLAGMVEDQTNILAKIADIQLPTKTFNAHKLMISELSFTI